MIWTTGSRNSGEDFASGWVATVITAILERDRGGPPDADLDVNAENYRADILRSWGSHHVSSWHYCYFSGGLFRNSLTFLF